MKKNFILSFLTFLLYLVFTSSNVSAQVSIAPVALYLDDDQTTGRIVVRNSSNEPQELSIDLVFGYPATDEEGNVFMNTVNAVPDEAPSAKDWVRVYPRHLVLPPKEQQTIRFSARPPAGLPDGEYWVRPVISSNNSREMNTSAGEDISANINMVKRTLLSLNYRRGNVQTGIDIGEITTSTVDNQLHLLAKLNRKGNAAYLGNAGIQIFDASDKSLHQSDTGIAVYYSQNRKFEVDISDLSPGTYRAELSFDTQKRAEDNKDIISASPASQSVEFTVQ